MPYKSEKERKMADGGIVANRDTIEPGVMDETEPPELKALKALSSVGDGYFGAKLGADALGGLAGLGEEGMASLGNAPKMEEPSDSGIDGIKVIVKGIQKGKDCAEMKDYGVEGKPEFLQKHFNDPAPASVPEAELRAKGFLPAETKSFPRNSPNGYAEGGMVQQDNGWMEKLKGYLASKHAPVAQQPQDTQSQLDQIDALERGPQVSTGTPHMASGGAVDFPHKEKSGPEINTVSHQKYADGGLVDDDSTDWMKGAAEKAAVPVMPSTPQPDTHFMSQLQNGTTGIPKFNPQSGLPPQPAPQMPLQPPQSPALAPNPVQAYVAAQKAQLDKYGPDQQMAVANRLTQQQQGLGSRVPVALGGLADAIMQGVARAGNPGFADRIQGQQNELANRQLGTMEKAGTQNIQQTEAKMKLDAIDAQSPLSKSKQQEYSPLLTKLGYKQDQISRMSSSDIENATQLMAQFGGKEIEAVIKRFELGLEAQKTAETGRHNRVEESNKSEETGVSAAKEILNGSKIPGVPPTHQAKLGAENVLEKAAGVAGTATITPQDQQAIQWAQMNPTDPRAAKILSLHGMR